MPPVLEARNLSKSFRHRDQAQAPTFRAWVADGFGLGRGVSRFTALEDVSIDLAPGEMVGVIGRNGSGKSTLLRLLSGVLRPDAGRVEARATVRGLLELNAGMHPDLSGRENIMIAGVLSGLLKSEIAARMDAIVAFAELQDHIEQPVRTYSSGMKLRLGFSVAVHVDPEILLIDEVLAVGDLAFQEKCLARIEDFRRQGCGIVFISHDMGQVRRNCDRVLWLDRGRVRMQGLPELVVQAYESAAHQQFPDQKAEVDAKGAGRNIRYGGGQATVSDVGLFGASGQEVTAIATGDSLTVRFRVSAPEPVQAHACVSITDSAGRLCFDANSETDRLALPVLEGSHDLSLELERLDLSPGRYFVSVGVWRADWGEAFDMHEDCYVFDILDGPRLQGVLAPPRRWRLQPRP